MEEFSVVQKIEATIEGLLTFAVRFLRTTLFLGFHPTCLSAIPTSDDKRYVFSHPFTYLTLTAVVFAPVSRFLARLIGEFIDMLGDLASIPARILGGWDSSANIGASPREGLDASLLALLRDMPDPSVDTIIKGALPIILAVTVMAALVGTVLERFSRIQRADFIRTACFIAGFQFVIFSIAVASVFAWFDLLPRSDLFTPLKTHGGSDLAVGAFVGVLLYILLWPALQLCCLFTEGVAPSRLKQWLRRLAALGVGVVLSGLLGAGATSVSLIPLGFAPPKTPAPPEHVWSVDSFEVVEGNRISARIRLVSHRAQPYLILDKPISLTIYARTGTFPPQKNVRATVPLALIAWSDRDHPVLEIKKGESKWMMLEGALDSGVVRDLHDAPPGQRTMVIALRGFGRNDDVTIDHEWEPRN